MSVFGTICIILLSISFIVRLILHYQDKKRFRATIDELNDEKRHYLYRWNVTSCRLSHLEFLAKQTLDEKSDGGGPYRSSPDNLIKALEDVRDVAGESLKEVCKEVQSFKSLQEVEAYLGTLKKNGPNAYPMIVMSSMWDGPCWHVVYSTENGRKAPSRCEAYMEHTWTCEIGNPTFPDDLCPYWKAFEQGVPLEPISDLDPKRISIERNEDGSIHFQYKEVEPTEIPPQGTKKRTT